MDLPPIEPVTWADLSACGVSRRRLRTWLSEGRLRRVFTGVYISAAVPDSLLLRARCAARILPANVVVCDRSAAWLHGVDVHDPDERFTIPDLEVVVAPGAEAPRRQGLRAGKRMLSDADITTIHGLRVTTPVRTALDLACIRGRWGALAVLDAFMHECGVTHQDLARALTRFSRRRGVTQARALVPLASPLAESPGESWTRAAIHDADLPTPALQVEILEDDVLMARLDHGYRQWRIAVEYDGEEFHGPEQAQHDNERRDWLRERGWHVIVVRKNQLSAPARDQWLSDLAHAIDQRSARTKRRYARRLEPWVRS